jgi:mRNA interferase YafQ
VRTAVRSGQFRRDAKRAARRGKDMSKLRELIRLLLAGRRCLSATGIIRSGANWRGYRDAHLEPDWLVIYRITGDELHLVRTGSHADLFDE